MVTSPRGSRSPAPPEVATGAPLDAPGERAGAGAAPTPPSTAPAAATSADWQPALDAVVPCVVVLKCVGVGDERSDRRGFRAQESAHPALSNAHLTPPPLIPQSHPGPGL